MLIILSILSACLLLGQSVSGAELHRSKRVPEEHKDVHRIPYHLNHPPSVESYIPVTVIYDNEENIHLLSKTVQEDETKTNNKPTDIIADDAAVASVTQHAIKAKALFANHPPNVENYNSIPVAVVVEGNEESNLKTIVSTEDDKNEHTDTSISTKVDNSTGTKNFTINDSDIKPKGRSVNLENGSISARNTIKEPSQRRRLHRVNKVTANKNQVTDKKTEDTDKNNTISSKVGESLNKTNQPTGNTRFQKRTQQRDPVVPIIDSENYVFAYNGDYHYSYEGGDGTKAYERGELKTIDGGSSGSGVVGGFSYTDKDGNDFSLSYTADENGYRPVGAHLPTPPPIPIAIQRALELLATKTTPEPITERVNKA